VFSCTDRRSISNGHHHRFEQHLGNAQQLPRLIEAPASEPNGRTHAHGPKASVMASKLRPTSCADAPGGRTAVTNTTQRRDPKFHGERPRPRSDEDPAAICLTEGPKCERAPGHANRGVTSASENRAR